MEPRTPRSLVNTGSIIGLLEAEEEIVAPDGGIVLSQSLRPVLAVPDNAGLYRYELGNTLVKRIAPNNRDKEHIPLYMNVNYALPNVSDPNLLCSLLVYLPDEKTFGSIFDMEEVDKGKIRVILNKSDKNPDALLKRILPPSIVTVSPENAYMILDGNPIFVNNPRSIGIKIDKKTAQPTLRPSNLLLANQNLFGNRGIREIKVKSLQGRTYLIDYDYVSVPDFLLVKQNPNEKPNQTPLFVFRYKETEFHIYHEEDKESLNHALKLEDFVSVLINDENFVGVVKELPSSDNMYYFGINLLSPRAQDKIILLSGEEGLYFRLSQCEKVSPVCYAVPGRRVEVVGFEHNGVTLDREEARILTTSDERDEVVLEFKKDIGGNSADGLGSPGRCLCVSSYFVRHKNDGIHVSSYLSSGLFFTILPEAQKELDGLLEAKPLKLREYADKYGYKTNLSNIIGMVLRVKDEVCDVPEFPNLLCVKGYLIPASYVIALYSSSARKISKTKKVTQEFLDDLENEEDRIIGSSYSPPEIEPEPPTLNYTIETALSSIPTTFIEPGSLPVVNAIQSSQVTTGAELEFILDMEFDDMFASVTSSEMDMLEDADEMVE